MLITNSDGTAIQNAVDHIQSGGTISLSGDFKLMKDSINIKKNLTLRGIGNAVLDRSGATKKDRVIRCQGNITLENLTLTGGYSTNGGGVKLDGGTVRIISCDIHGNTGIFGGGGIHSQADTLELAGCDISENVSMVAGGGISAVGGTITMSGCNLTGNEAQNSYGGAVGALRSTITMNDCKITANSAPKAQGGGIALVSSASVTATSCDISGNIAPESPDIYIDGSSSTDIQ
ncbi:MAG: hypothetical protein IJR85_10390 [Synergistaceae bacterium]|nr:hypothetical protein [Synergistaceae bacterium]